MCGVAALFSSEPALLAPPIEEMITLARHRGPDDRGFVLGSPSEILARDRDTGSRGTWALGHARLSIQDLSSAGHQPMADRAGQTWVTFNGEVYNFLELRKELQMAGYEFRTGTDTEVLLASWHEWGPACVNHFIGMFAFVLVDLKSRIAFAARDRLGIKPLYYTTTGRLAAFASEPKQFAGLGGFSYRADQQQTLDFLVDGVIGHDPEKCAFENIRVLPAGHTIQWPLDAPPGSARAHPYWQPSTTTVPQTVAEAAERTRELFASAVELRLRADVPVGSCLSGGVDSSAIVGTATANNSKPFHAFTAVFEDPRFDESLYVEAVRKHTGCISHLVFPKPEELIEELEDLVYHQDEPFISFSKYAQWCVMRRAKQEGVTVLLDGQGGDEAFCGYRKFAFFYLKQLVREGRISAAARHGGDLVRYGDGRLFEFSAGHRYLPSFLRKRLDPSGELLSLKATANRREAWRERTSADANLHDHQLADFRFWSLPALLRYEDRNSMAHSIETRLPLLDHRLLEHLLTIPEAYFFDRGRTKPLLKQAAGARLAPEVRDRRTKLGFDTPQDRWLEGELGQILEDRIERSELLKTLLDLNRVREAFNLVRGGSAQSALPRFLIRAATVALWEQRFDL